MHDHNHANDDGPISRIRTAFFLNFAFTIVEIIGGFYTNSIAILTDALHDFGDSIALGLSWYFEKVAKRKETESFSFGYRRFSLLAAIISGLVLIAGSGFMLTEAIPRLWNPVQPDAHGMMFFAIGGIVVNGLAVLRVRKGKTMNERMIAWHLLEDVLGWVAVLIVSLVLMVKDIPILDPILSILITGFILYNGFHNIRKTAKLFLQGTPDPQALGKIREAIIKLPGVKSSHQTHFWSLDGENHVLSTHIIVANELSRNEVATIKVKVRKLAEELEIGHVTIETEYEDENCELEKGEPPDIH